MSLTKRTYTDILGNTLVSTGSVTGATTKLTMVFTANNTLWGVQSTINVYVERPIRLNPGWGRLIRRS